MAIIQGAALPCKPGQASVAMGPNLIPGMNVVRLIEVVKIDHPRTQVLRHHLSDMLKGLCRRPLDAVRSGALFSNGTPSRPATDRTRVPHYPVVPGWRREPLLTLDRVHSIRLWAYQFEI